MYYAINFQQTPTASELAQLRVRWHDDSVDEVWHGHKDLLTAEIIDRLTKATGIIRIKYLITPPFFTAPDRTTVQLTLQTYDQQDLFLALQTLQKEAEAIIAINHSAPELEFQRRRAMIDHLPLEASIQELAHYNHPITVFQLSTYSEAIVIPILQHLRSQKVHHYRLKKKTLYAYLSGQLVDQLRLSLVPADLKMPFGQEEGAVQIHATPTTQSGISQYTISKIGGLVNDFMQIRNDGTLCKQDGAVHPEIAQYIQQHLGGTCITVEWVTAPTGDASHAIAFEVPMPLAFTPPLAITVSNGTEHMVEYKMPPISAHKHTSVSQMAETQFEHWMNQAPSSAPTDLRPNCIAPIPSHQSSYVRSLQVQNCSVDTGHTFVKCSYIDEPFPWIMAETVIDRSTIDTLLSFFKRPDGFLAHQLAQNVPRDHPCGP